MNKGKRLIIQLLNRNVVASLTLGAAVTCTVKGNAVSKAGDFAGTIVAVDDSRATGYTRLVRGAKSGKESWMSPAMLRHA